MLIHWGVGVVWAQPLLDEPALADGYRLLSYHRAGFAGNSQIEGTDHAEHCRLLMRQVGIERAHIVGHSMCSPPGNVAAMLAERSRQMSEGGTR